LRFQLSRIERIDGGAIVSVYVQCAECRRPIASEEIAQRAIAE
jgi:hypothetical protein